MKASELKKLKPSDIVGIKMDSDRILHIWFNHPVLNSDVDYKTALYASKKQKELEKVHGECLGLFMDINNYNRLDHENFFGISLPSAKVRKIHHDLVKDSKLKHIAVYKEEAPRIVQACARIVLLAQDRQIKIFSDKNKALKWLKEGIEKELSESK